MNGDGRLDIISGCYSVHEQNMVAPVYVLYRTEAGDFEEAVALKNSEGEHLLALSTDRSRTTEQICGEPFAHDLDGDGDLDLIIGNFDGRFLLSTNVGTKEEPAFEGTAEYVTNAAGERLRLQGGNHGAPFLVDWDDDGDVDLISGSGRGGVQIAENDPAEDGTPVFSDFRVLLQSPSGTRVAIHPSDAPITMGTSWRVRVADYDADGKLDLIVGDCLRRSVAKEGLTVEEATTRQAAWAKERSETQAAMRETEQRLRDLRAKPVRSKPPEEVEEKATEEEEPVEEEASAEELEKKLAELRTASREHYTKRAEFLDSVATGHVWVYLRK